VVTTKKMLDSKLRSALPARPHVYTCSAVATGDPKLCDCFDALPGFATTRTLAAAARASFVALPP